MSDSTQQQPTSNTELEDLVASTDTGGRNPGGPIGKFLAGVALVWALFQLWIASPLPYIIGIGVFNDTEARSIHLAFAIFLAFTAFPAGKKSAKDYVPAIDWLLAIVASASAAYLYIFYESLSYRPGNPNEYDIAVACVGIVLLLLATIRCLGAPLAVVALVFLLYCFGGQSMPGILAWKGASFGAVADTQWMSTDGVFGVPLGVSTKFVFLFCAFWCTVRQGWCR